MSTMFGRSSERAALAASPRASSAAGAPRCAVESPPVQPAASSKATRETMDHRIGITLHLVRSLLPDARFRGGSAGIQCRARCRPSPEKRIGVLIHESSERGPWTRADQAEAGAEDVRCADLDRLPAAR